MVGNRSRKPGQGDSWGFDSSALRDATERHFSRGVACPRSAIGGTYGTPTQRALSRRRVMCAPEAAVGRRTFRSWCPHWRCFSIRHQAGFVDAS